MELNDGKDYQSISGSISFDKDEESWVQWSNFCSQKPPSVTISGVNLKNPENYRCLGFS